MMTSLHYYKVKRIGITLPELTLPRDSVIYYCVNFTYHFIFIYTYLAKHCTLPVWLKLE